MFPSICRRSSRRVERPAARAPAGPKTELTRSAEGDHLAGTSQAERACGPVASRGALNPRGGGVDTTVEARVARRRLLQDFCFGYRQDPSLPLQLWLDGAAGPGDVRGRLSALHVQRQELAARGVGPGRCWWFARTAAYLPPPHEAEIVSAGQMLLSSAGRLKLDPAAPEFPFVCLLACSAEHAPALDLGGRGIDAAELALLAPLLGTLPRLETLDLESNQLEEGAVHELIELALRLPGLARVHLSGNPLPPNGREVVEQLFQVRTSEEALMRLNNQAICRRDWSRLTTDGPLQLGLRRSGERLAGRLSACIGLARVAGLDLSGVIWRDLATLERGLGALAGARALWSLRLRLDPEPASRAQDGSWWAPALHRLAALPRLRVLDLDGSPMRSPEDVWAFDHHVGQLAQLELVVLDRGVPAWVGEEGGAGTLEVLIDILDREKLAVLPALEPAGPGKAVHPLLALTGSCEPPAPQTMARDLSRACSASSGTYLLHAPGTRMVFEGTKGPLYVLDGGPKDLALMRAALWPELWRSPPGTHLGNPALSLVVAPREAPAVAAEHPVRVEPRPTAIDEGGLDEVASRGVVACV